ncbi:MAG: hypothetical protein R2771_11380 [Saprospiraceae bacterium]
MTNSLFEIITILSGFTNYNPGNDDYSIESLTAKHTNLNLLNDTVIQKLTEKQDATRLRMEIYVELKDRVKRIKSYVRSKYGTNSPEYGKIRSMRF